MPDASDIRHDDALWQTLLETRADCHVLLTPRDCDCEGLACPVCCGGLAICRVCGGAEGSLPTQCPGRRMTGDEEDDVYDGRLDFRDGEWRKESKWGPQQEWTKSTRHNGG